MSDLKDVQDALKAATCRVEFGFAFLMSGTVRTAQTVKVYKRTETPSGREKWVQVGPAILPPDGKEDSRAALLETLADIIDADLS